MKLREEELLKRVNNVLYALNVWKGNISPEFEDRIGYNLGEMIGTIEELKQNWLTAIADPEAISNELAEEIANTTLDKIIETITQMRKNNEISEIIS